MVKKQLSVIIFCQFVLLCFSSSSFLPLVLQDTIPICYGATMDAGSSGTRIYVYNWPCRQVAQVPILNIQQTAPNKNINPGLGTYANNITGIQQYLQPLLDFAASQIPVNQLGTSPIFLRATAGLRVLSQQDQSNIMQQVQNILSNSGFLFLKSDWAQVITGQWEGALGWTSINFLLGQIDMNQQTKQNTSIVIDVGGASCQLSFLPVKKEVANINDIDVQIPHFNIYHIYSYSYLGYGNDMARNSIIQEANNSNYINETFINYPCGQQGMQIPWSANLSITLNGTGNVTECMILIQNFLNITNCPYGDQTKKNCGANNTFQADLPQNQQIFGISSIQKISSFFNMSAQFQLKDLRNATQNFCQLQWDFIQQQSYYSPYCWSNCFAGLYITELLINGFNIQEDRLINSLGSINGIETTWTIASIIIDVSKYDCKYDSPICIIFNQLFKEININQIF